VCVYELFLSADTKKNIVANNVAVLSRVLVICGCSGWLAYWAPLSLVESGCDTMAMEAHLDALIEHLTDLASGADYLTQAVVTDIATTQQLSKSMEMDSVDS
jgi:hypothetical protein